MSAQGTGVSPMTGTSGYISSDNTSATASKRLWSGRRPPLVENGDLYRAQVPDVDSSRDPAAETDDIRLRNPEEADNISLPSNWSETTNVPKRTLGFIQITSLMINSVIGTGIFNTPGYVLALTRSKPLALSFWALGGIYTAMW